MSIAPPVGALNKYLNGLSAHAPFAALRGMAEGFEAALPGPLRETAFALAVEIAAADSTIAFEEMRVLQMIRERLEVDNLIAAAIERSARARYARG